MAAETQDKKVTPLMQQYNSIKRKYPDALLLFRVGDFYETFGNDAVQAARILNIVLTNRNNGGEKTELAGFPHHSLNTYLPKLVRAGHRVAICDQLEDPKTTKKIVKRGVTELVTPGVSMNDEVLERSSNNFLCAIHFGKSRMGVAFLDVSTGEFMVAQGSAEYISKLLQNFQPSEVLVPKMRKKEFQKEFGDQFYCFYLEDWVYKKDYAYEALNTHFETHSLKGFGIEELEEAVIAGGAAFFYLGETQHHKLQHVNKITRIAEDDYIWMDRFTIRNLELYFSQTPGAVTLLEVLDQTISPMGARMLKRWMALPLKNSKLIAARQELVRFLYSHQSDLRFFQDQINQINDLERLVSKVATGKVNPREVVQLKKSLDAILPIKEKLCASEDSNLIAFGKGIDQCHDIRTQIGSILCEDAGTSVSKGNCIAEGYSDELDELRNILYSGKDYLEKLVERESEKTGISSLKIASNNVFGYYIEVRNAHKSKVPESWIRKQTLVNAERYITEELKQYEEKIFGAEEKILSLEQDLFEKLVLEISKYISTVQKNAHLVAQLDCLCSFAHQALQENYSQPIVDDSFEIEITAGRHPVIEKQLPITENYIPNDIYLDREQQQIMMITGPNMSGKSAILRQTALIVLMAQMGSFVPADKARIGIVDKIFTRVGASDNISLGESTFMVEMNETATILNNLSDRSLVLLDEIGRGTSTYDGISIAWAITEFLHEHPAKAKTLFATHYHELNDMAATFSRIKNFNVSIKELKDKVLFLRKLASGGSEHSFGIHVAKMAGMPQQVIQKANKILKRLEESHGAEGGKKKLKADKDDAMQLSFFQLDDPILEELKEDILQLNIDELTPVEALMKLNEIRRMLLPQKETGVSSNN